MIQRQFEINVFFSFLNSRAGDYMMVIRVISDVKFACVLCVSLKLFILKFSYFQTLVCPEILVHLAQCKKCLSPGMVQRPDSSISP